jgi:hypothetical protein
MLGIEVGLYGFDFRIYFIFFEGFDNPIDDVQFIFEIGRGIWGLI